MRPTFPFRLNLKYQKARYNSPGTWLVYMGDRGHIGYADENPEMFCDPTFAPLLASLALR